MEKAPDPCWLLLVLTLPGRQPALRMRIWRRLRLAGCAVLRDGVYVLPDRAPLRQLLRAVTAEVQGGKGSARLLTVRAPAEEFQPLFDRSSEYEALLEDISGVSGRLATARNAAGRLASRVEALRKSLAQLEQIDHFPGPLQQRTRQALAELVATLQDSRSPGEPHARRRAIPALDRADFQDRVWATRARPWVDRLASAWLIRRFIDHGARFRWAKKPDPHDRRSIGFDFDGAAFSHVGDRVTFEVLAESFGLLRQPGVQAIARIVHYLDVGGLPVPEAAGVETMLRGLRERHAGDDELFKSAAVVFDSLLAAHQAPERRK